MQELHNKFKTDLSERCRQFSIQVIQLTDKLPNKRSAWVITDQLIRSATSVGANIVEGKAASSRLEFKKFYECALKSANESRYWLDLIKSVDLVGTDDLQLLIRENDEICRMLAAGVIKLKKN